MQGMQAARQKLLLAKRHMQEALERQTALKAVTRLRERSVPRIRPGTTLAAEQR